MFFSDPSYYYNFFSFSSPHTDIETNECLNNNGGCWQDKTANITACKVLMELFILTEVFLFLCMFDMCMFLLRIHSVEECASVPLFRVCSSREMVTLIVKVNVSLSLSLLLMILLCVEV